MSLSESTVSYGNSLDWFNATYFKFRRTWDIPERQDIQKMTSAPELGKGLKGTTAPGHKVRRRKLSGMELSFLHILYTEHNSLFSQQKA